MSHAAPTNTGVRLAAAAASAARIFVAGAGTTYLALGRSPLEMGMDNWRIVASAGLGALALTAINWARRGDPRFGRGA